jgi:hypothetical protein
VGLSEAKKTCSKPETESIDCRLEWEAVEEIRQAKERKAFFREQVGRNPRAVNPHRASRTVPPLRGSMRCGSCGSER